MRTQNILTLDLLANHSDQVVLGESKYTFLQGYEELRECKCWRAMDRAETELNGYGKDIVNVPRGFINPLDFFDTVISKYLAERFHNQKEINIMSFGAGFLLHEVFIITKLLKELEKYNEKISKIILHAVDIIYKKSERISEEAWRRSSNYLCQEHFNSLIKQLGVDVALRIYSSIGKYNKESSINSPSIILAIDVPFRLDPDFPLPNQKEYSSTSLEYTQQGILEKTKEISQEGSLVVSFTHLDTNRGLFIVIEEKVKSEYKKTWIHTISSTTQLSIAPPPVIEQEISDKANQYLASPLGKYELSQKKRFVSAPLSQAAMDPKTSVTFRDSDGTIIKTLLDSETTDINAQCSDGFTALHWAAIHKNEKLIRILVRRGADLTKKNKYGRTALDYYKHQPCPEDFKNFIDEEFYNELCKSHTGTSTEVMPELNDAYFSRGWKEAAIVVKHSINPGVCQILSQNKNQATDAVVISKPFIASPIHTALPSSKQPDGNINLTHGAIQIIFKMESNGSDWCLEVINTERLINREYAVLYRDKKKISQIHNYLLEKNTTGLIAFIRNHGISAKAIAQYLHDEIKIVDLNKPKK